MNIGYVRVSTAEQNEDRQIEAISKTVSNIDKWFTEKVSGKNTEREQFKQMMNFVREGDCVYVLDWSRLSRSTKDLFVTIESLEKKGVKLVSLKESFDTSSPTGKLMLGLISSINQYEREILLERQREG
ncbi:MAG: recombinase family protein, partial [Oscillospiraceae bacterium]|nr:recombinase family protein [Oscillospiraceae bacterium]